MGAMAMFGEAYPDEVRVVEIGGPFSLELCGGTHVHNSAQIGPVTILGESSVGSGVRRVEAYVGLESFKHLAKERALMAGLASSLKVPSEEVPARVANLVERLKVAEKEIDRNRLANARAAAANAAAGAQHIGNVRLVAQRMSAGMTAADLRSLVGDIRGKLGTDPAVVALIAEGTAAAFPTRSRPIPPPRISAFAPTTWSSSWRQRSTAAAVARPTSRRARGRIRRASTRRSTLCGPRSPGPAEWTRRIACRTGPAGTIPDQGGGSASTWAASASAWRPATRTASLPRRSRRCAATDPRSTFAGWSSWSPSCRPSRWSSGCREPWPIAPARRPSTRSSWLTLLAGRIAPIPVRMADERLTTVSAQRSLRQAGVRAKGQRRVIDQAAAVAILQGWLDERRAMLPGEVNGV